MVDNAVDMQSHEITYRHFLVAVKFGTLAVAAVAAVAVLLIAR